MTLNITDAELHEWAKMRADDAGRLARELVACRRQSQAAVAAAYEAAAQVAIGRKGFGSDAALVHPYDKGYVAACDAITTAIRALATPDQIAALAAERAADQAEIELLLKNHNGMSAEITRLRAVIAKDAAQMIEDQHKLHKAVEALRGLVNAVCGPVGLAEAIRHNSGCSYPWPPLDAAEAKARAVLAEIGGA